MHAGLTCYCSVPYNGTTGNCPQGTDQCTDAEACVIETAGDGSILEQRCLTETFDRFACNPHKYVNSSSGQYLTDNCNSLQMLQIIAVNSTAASNVSQATISSSRTLNLVTSVIAGT